MQRRLSVGIIVGFALVPPARAVDDQPFGGIERVLKRAQPCVVKIYGAAAGRTEGFGSGVLVSPGGQVVTVLSAMLEGANLRGVTADGTTYPARVVRRDDARQLALLELNLRAVHGSAAVELPFLRLAEAGGARPGDWMIAIGNCFQVAEGAEPVSVMLGVLSARAELDARRYAQDYPYNGEVLVVDAITSNPGMAGGALLTMDGRWVGLVGRIAQSNLTGTRLNYALPAEVVGEFLQQPGEVTTVTPGNDSSQLTGTATKSSAPGYHGIRLFELGYRRNLVFVDGVQRDSPAERAGLRKDDLIVSVDGRPVPRARVFHEYMNARAAGETVTLIVKRRQALLTMKLTLEELK